MGIVGAPAYTHSVSVVSDGELYQVTLSGLKQNLAVQSTVHTDK